jgi:outer membrane protein assembly factor BamB
VFALDAATGAIIWMTSQEVARLTGLTQYSTDELHEQIGYSSPLVLNERIYVGIADHCDNPIQNGRVIAVDLFSGNIVGGFKFEATSDRGGGIWTYLSGGLAGGVFTTTGNTRRGSAPEPAVNHGLSMIRLNPGSGALEGKMQPVPFEKDGDPDWSSGATLMNASCGPLVVSTMKDGWTYAANAGPPLDFRWQFPSVAYPFPKDDPNDHGDIHYHRVGAAWEDVFILDSPDELGFW